MEDLKCLIGMHKYEKDQELEVTDARGNLIGKTIVCICKNCGKVKATSITTVG